MVELLRLRKWNFHPSLRGEHGWCCPWNCPCLDIQPYQESVGFLLHPETHYDLLNVSWICYTWCLVIFCTFCICFEYVASQQGTAQANHHQKNLRKTAELCLVTKWLQPRSESRRFGVVAGDSSMREGILTLCQQDTQGAVNLNCIRDPPIARML